MTLPAYTRLVAAVFLLGHALLSHAAASVRVVIARSEKHTVVTMPVKNTSPATLAKLFPAPITGIRQVDSSLVERLDRFSAPRLVGYRDPDPCRAFPQPNGRVIAAAASDTGEAMVQFTMDSAEWKPPGPGAFSRAGLEDVTYFFLTPRGTVAQRGAPSAKAPSGMDVPAYLAGAFDGFYAAVFRTAASRSGSSGALIEFAGSVSACDFCPTPPLTRDELLALGASWTTESAAKLAGNPFMGIEASPVRANLTRLHFPSGQAAAPITFEEKPMVRPFQSYFVVNFPAETITPCQRAKWYGEAVRLRHDREAHTVAALTEWPVADVYRHMGVAPSSPPQDPGEEQDEAPKKWYQKFFR